MTTWLYRIALTLVFVTAAVLSLRQVGSLDVGFHLKAGQYILSEGGWPTTDPFTFTVNDNAYIDTSWGYQVLLVLVHRAFGVSGLTLLHVSMVLGTFLLLWLTARLHDADPLSVVLFLGLGVLAAEMRFAVRPEGLSHLLLAGVLYVLHRHASGRSAPLLLLPPIFLLWTNVHSLVVLGWIALACFVIASVLRDRKIDRPLVGWSAASMAVALINPYGFQALTFPLTLATRMSEGNVFGQTIGEFVPPLTLKVSDAYPFIPWAPVTSFKILLMLSVIAAVRLLLARRFHAALLIVPGVVLGLQMIRNLPVLVIFCVVGVIWALPLGKALERWTRNRASMRTRLECGAYGLMIVMAVTFALRVMHDGYYVETRRSERFGLGWSALSQPLEVPGHVEAAGLSGPMLNHLNFGGYMMWSRPDPVFIDGRLEVMGERFFDYYRSVLASPEGLKAAVSRYDIRWIVFPYKINGRLLRRLSDDPGWRLTHVDGLAAVFARRDVPGTADASARRALGSAPGAPLVLDALPGLQGHPPPSGGVRRWASGLVRRQDFPTNAFSLGLFHYFRGEMQPAASYFAQAIRQSDGAYYEIYNNLGAALARLNRPVDAAACYRVALANGPDSPDDSQAPGCHPKPSRTPAPESARGGATMPPHPCCLDSGFLPAPIGRPMPSAWRCLS